MSIFDQVMMVVGFGQPKGPRNTVAPVITGVTEVPETLTCSIGTWTGTGIITYAYQWRLDNVNITGETSSTYVLQYSDEGGMISCRVTATDDEGSRGRNAVEVGHVTLNNDLISDLVEDLFEDTLLEIDPLFEIEEVV